MLKGGPDLAREGFARLAFMLVVMTIAVLRFRHPLDRGMGGAEGRAVAETEEEGRAAHAGPANASMCALRRAASRGAQAAASLLKKAKIVPVPAFFACRNIVAAASASASLP